MYFVLNVLGALLFMLTVPDVIIFFHQRNFRKARRLMIRFLSSPSSESAMILSVESYLLDAPEHYLSQLSFDHLMFSACAHVTIRRGIDRTIIGRVYDYYDRRVKEMNLFCVKNGDAIRICRHRTV